MKVQDEKEELSNLEAAAHAVGDAASERELFTVAVAVSQNNAAYVMAFTEWSCLSRDADGGIDLDMNRSTPEGHERILSTLSMLHQMVGRLKHALHDAEKLLQHVEQGAEKLGYVKRPVEKASGPH